jgi:hypothetical protein
LSEGEELDPASFVKETFSLVGETIYLNPWQAPNNKHHKTNKFQSPESETKSFRSFEIGVWDS